MRNSHFVLLAVLGLVGLMRIGELSIARRRLKTGQLSPEPEPVFPWMVALHSSMFVLVPLEVFGLDRGFSPLLFAAAAIVLAVGTTLRFMVLNTLGEQWNVRVVRPSDLIVSGPYRYVRHPNYLAVILEIPSICLLHGAWVSALLLSAANGFVLFLRIRREEAVLDGVPGYRELMGGKPRFVPRLGR